jgi:hypothetical protein
MRMKGDACLKLAGLGAGLILAASVGYGLRALAEGAPTTKPLFYSGTLEANGKLASGPYAIVLALFDAESAGTRVCVSESADVPVEAGRFRVEVSADCVKVFQMRPDVWAALKFTGPDGVPHELLKRSKIGAVPFSLEAQHAVSATKALSADTATSANTAAEANHAAAANTATMATSATTAATAGAVSTSAVTIETANCVLVSNSFTDCTCAAGGIAIGGGACAGVGCGAGVSALTETRSVAAGVWRLACENSAGSRVACLAPSVVCLKSR